MDPLTPIGTRRQITKRNYAKKRREEIKAAVDALKNHPCMDCGGKFPPVCMDWDHVRGTKVRAVSQMIVRRLPVETILMEIAKCDLVCSNCHRIRTQERR